MTKEQIAFIFFFFLMSLYLGVSFYGLIAGKKWFYEPDENGILEKIFYSNRNFKRILGKLGLQIYYFFVWVLIYVVFLIVFRKFF